MTYLHTCSKHVVCDGAIGSTLCLGTSIVVKLLCEGDLSLRQQQIVTAVVNLLSLHAHPHDQFVCTLSSAGSDLAPHHIPPASLVIWRAILAGGIAGVVSRTATAPLEKIKILAQVSLISCKCTIIIIVLISVFRQAHLAEFLCFSL